MVNKSMPLYFIKLAHVVVGFVVPLILCGDATADEAQLSTQFVNHSQVHTMNTTIPNPKLRTTIDMGAEFYVVRLAFSPDSRYIAVGDGSSPNIVIWDLIKNKEQTRILARAQDMGGRTWMHWDPWQEILWSPDGRYITNGIGNAGIGNVTEANDKAPILQVIKKIEFWDPMTGKVIKELDAVSFRAKLNKDGSKLVTSSAVSGKEYVFDVFDTHTWQGKELKTVGIRSEILAWTTDGSVMAIGALTGKSGEKTPQFLNDSQPKLRAMLAEFIDPFGKMPTHTMLLAPPVLDKDTAKRELPDSDPMKSSFAFQPHAAVSDFSGNKVAIRLGGFVDQNGKFTYPKFGEKVADLQGVMMVDTKNFQVLFTHLDGENSPVRGGENGIAFSPDGKYLFLLANDIHDKDVTSLILDAQTGKQVGSFPSHASWGLSISPDGKTMAVGHGRYIEFFDLQ